MNYVQESDHPDETTACYIPNPRPPHWDYDIKHPPVLGRRVAWKSRLAGLAIENLQDAIISNSSGRLKPALLLISIPLS